MPSFYQKIAPHLDEPIEFSYKMNIFKKGRLRIIIINEDLSFNEYFRRLPKKYVINIKDKSYYVVPKAIIRGKYNTIVYFYNNPFPLFLEYQKASSTAKEFYDPAEFLQLSEQEQVLTANVIIDAKMVKLGMDTTAFQGFYERPPGLTTKSFLIIFGAIVITVLVFLQLTGKIDIWSILTGGQK